MFQCSSVFARLSEIGKMTWGFCCACIESTGTLEHVYKRKDLNWNTASLLEHLAIAPLAGPARANVGALPAGESETACYPVCGGLILSRYFHAKPLKNFRNRDATPSVRELTRSSISLFPRIRNNFFLPDVRDESGTLFFRSLFNDFRLFQPPSNTGAVSGKCLCPELVTIPPQTA